MKSQNQVVRVGRGVAGKRRHEHVCMSFHSTKRTGQALYLYQLSMKRIFVNQMVP